jgi:hypothetical protein
MHIMLRSGLIIFAVLATVLAWRNLAHGQGLYMQAIIAGMLKREALEAEQVMLLVEALCLVQDRWHSVGQWRRCASAVSAVARSLAMQRREGHHHISLA